MSAQGKNRPTRRTPKAKPTRKRTEGMVHGDVRMVQLMTIARELNGGNGYSYSYVRKCLSENDTRDNAEVKALHRELVAMRTRTTTPRRRK